MSANLRPCSYCFAAVLFALLVLAGCTQNPRSESAPEYLQSEIRKYPPDPSGLTAYPLNGPFGGNITSLARVGQSDIVIAGTREGEFFRSIDGGHNWTRAISESHDEVQDIVSVNNLLIAGARDGIFRSVDGGLSWHRISIATDPQPLVYAIVLFKAQFLTITSQGIFRSENGGQSWLEIVPTQVPSPPGDSDEEARVRGQHLAVLGNTVMVTDGVRVLASEDLQRWFNVDQGLDLIAPDSDNPGTRLWGLTSAKGAAFIIRSSDGKATSLYRKVNQGSNWIKVRDFGYARSLTALDNSLFVITGTPREETIDLLTDDQWRELSGPPDEKVNDVCVVGDIVLAATTKGIYRSSNNGNWTASYDGVRSTRKTAGSLLAAGAFWFAVVDAKLFKSSGGNDSWSHIGKDFSLEGLDQGAETPTVLDIASFGSWLFVTTNLGLYRGRLEGGTFSRQAPPKDAKLATDFGRFGSLLSTNKQLFVSTGARIFSTTDGETWEEISAGLEKVSRLFSQVKFGRAGEFIFLSAGEPASTFGQTAEKRSVYRLRKGERKWEEVSTGTQTPVTAFASVGESVYAAASGPDRAWAVDKFAPQLLRLDHANDSTWRPVEAVGLDGQVHSLWIDPAEPEVIFAGTSRGLFWTKDSGRNFKKSTSPPGGLVFSQVGDIALFNDRLFANTDAGVSYLHDQIPRGNWYAVWVDRAKQNLWLISGTLIALVAVIVLSTRLISLLLQLDLWGINQIAPGFYLLPFGRWKLYRGYRARLRAGVGLAEDIKFGVEHYVDLPFEVDERLCDEKLSEFFARQTLERRIVLDADGGRGKSTLCHYLARRCVNERGLFAGRNLVPVVIDGLTYTGELLNAITNALKENYAYVNKTIVASQIAAGHLLVIFDGFSEIKESYLAAASSSDLPEFIQQHPDTPFMFSSRSVLPSRVMQALKDPIVIKLRNVDETTERVFLSQYLKRGEQDVEVLVNEIKMRFNDLPRIPLMLKLIATVYDKKARVPKDRATLFADYAEQVLRPEATGIEYPSGLLFAIRHLVRETYLRSGGDRGFTEERAIDVLKEIKDQLAAREIELSPIRLLQLLTRAGLYKQVGENLKFFHDSFESYFGARALENDFRAGRYDLIHDCAGNERLAETWRFLSEILEETGDKLKLDSFLLEKAADLSTAAYLKTQRDPEVDYYLHISEKGNKYAGEMYTSQGKQPLHIRLSLEGLATLSRELRTEMDRMAMSIGATAGGSSRCLEDHLPHMARLGNYAFKQIFTPSAELDTFAKLRLPNQSGSIQIATDSFFFPWELIYPVDLNDRLSYELFWGMNHVISRLIIQEPRHDVADVVIVTRDRTKVGVLIDEDIDQLAKEEISFFTALNDSGKIDLHVFAPTSALDRRSRVHHVRAFLANNFDIIHFTCNSSYNKTEPNDSTIDLAHNWQLKLSDIEFYDFVVKGNPLIVMNTCESGNIDALKVSGFAATFLKRGARGVVATESNIPAATAGAFTQLLYGRLLAGENLGQSLMKVRRALWEKDQNPVGLLYSMYAPPSLSLGH